MSGNKMDTHTLVDSNHIKPTIVSNGNCSINNNSTRTQQQQQQQQHDIVQMQLEIQTTTPTAGTTVNTSIHSMHKGKAMRQVVAAFIANLGTINTGLAFGFSAVVIPQLQQADSIIKIDDNQKSWIASLSSLSTPIGCILSGWMMDRFGRKKTLLLTEIPLILGWLLISMATDIRMIYGGRLLVGLGSGMVGAPARVYTSEVTQPHLRGMLGALASVGISFGVLSQYILGTFLRWQILSAISAIIPIAAFIFMCLMPESPNYLVSRSKSDKALKSLTKLRGSKCNIQHEVDHLKQFTLKTQATARKPTFKETISALLSPAAMKPFGILVMYFMLYQFSGVNTITFYAVDIFKISGSEFDPNYCTIFMGVFRLIFTIIACISMRHCGRRPLTFISSIGCGTSLIGLGLYLLYKFRLEQSNPGAIMPATWFPVLCIFAFTICCTMGYLVVPWVMIGELYPQKVRGIVGGMTTFSAHSFVFIVVKTYPKLTHVFEYHGTFLLYGSISMAATLFYYFYLPETKGRTLQEIEDYFSGRTTTLKTKKIATASNFTINLNEAAKEQTLTVEKEKLLLA